MVKKQTPAKARPLVWNGQLSVRFNFFIVASKSWTVPARVLFCFNFIHHDAKGLAWTGGSARSDDTKTDNVRTVSRMIPILHNDLVYGGTWNDARTKYDTQNTGSAASLLGWGIVHWGFMFDGLKKRSKKDTTRKGEYCRHGGTLSPCPKTNRVVTSFSSRKRSDTV